MPNISLGINVDVHNFFNTAAYFYFLMVLELPVSHMALRIDLRFCQGDQMCPCTHTYKKAERQQRDTVSTQSFTPGLQKEAVVVTLSKVICRFSSKGLDAFSTLNN